MKITKFKKAAAIGSAFFIISSSAHSVASNASIKKDSDYTVSSDERLTASETTETEDSAEEKSEEERVAESDSAPDDAELMTNPEYKNKFAQIGDDEILDNDDMPKFYDENIKEENAKELEKQVAKNEKKPKQEEESKNIPEYKGTYGGSIRTIRPKQVTVSDGEDKDSKKIVLEEKNENSSETIAEEKKTDSEEIAKNEENAETAENAEKNEEAAPVIVPSRSVAMKSGQYLEVTYPGKGWAFLGDDESKELLAFYGRKISDDDTTFTLRSKKAGDTLLHFYKIDLLTGQYIDDYLAVSVSSEVASGSEKNSKVIAPLYAEYVPPRPDRSRDNGEAENAESVAGLKDSPKNKTADASQKDSADQKKSGAKEDENAQTQTTDANVKTNIQTAKQTSAENAKKAEKTAENKNDKTSPKNTQTAQNAQAAKSNEVPKQKENSEAAVTPEPKTKVAANDGNAEAKQDEQKKNDAESGNLFERAKKAYAEKRYADALDLAQKYLEISVNDTDEVLYLLGQIWEAESSVKNIKFSINSYDALIKNYPMSNLWRKANQRLVYLKRFYVDIR